MSRVGQSIWHRVVVAGAVVLSLVVPALARTSTSNALPDVAGCGVAPETSVRCPSVLERSPDVPSFNQSLVADSRRHRVYVVGPDAGGWQCFLSTDTRTGRRLVQRSFRATRFPDYYAFAINSYAAALTPDGRTVVSAGHVYQPDAWQSGLVAIDTATGKPRWSWVGAHRGPDDTFQALVVDPAGKRVFAVGREASAPDGSYEDRAVIRAFDLGSGRQLWHADVTTGDAVDRWFSAVQYVDDRVVATGTSMNANGNLDQFAASVNPVSGKVLRARTFDDGGDEFGEASAALPDGDVVMTGEHSPADLEYGPVSDSIWDVDARALDARTLAPEWHAQTTGGVGHGDSIAVAGSTVVIGYNAPAYGVFSDPTVAATAGPSGTGPSLLVLAAGSGAELHRWTNLMPVADTPSYAYGLQAAHGTAYLVGASSAADVSLTAAPPVIAPAYGMNPSDGVVAAVDLSTGAVRWTSDYNDDASGADHDVFAGFAVTPDGLFVAGSMDTRSRLPWGGAVNGAVLRFDL